jgi:hypothetical protein
MSWPRRTVRCSRWLLGGVLALLLGAEPARAQSAPEAHAPGDDDGVTVSLITFGRGDEVHQYFGHNALVVARPGERTPTVFNYGMFSFGPGMLPKFLKGRLEFWVGTSPLRETALLYRAMNRDVRLRELALEPAAVSGVVEKLEHDVLPENRVYLYDHYRDNCSTRVRDILDHALGGQLKRAWSTPGRFTLREQTRRYTQHDPVMEWLMMFGLNDTVDRPLRRWDEAFLPDELEHLVDGASYLNGAGARVKLVKRAYNLSLAQRAPVADAPVVRWPENLAISAAIGALAIVLGLRSRKRGETSRAFLWLATLLGMMLGVLGTLLTLMASFSDHVVTYHNENLFLANPITLFAGVLGLIALRRRLSARWLVWPWACMAATTLVLLVGKLVVPALDQDVSLTATLIAPINLALAVASCLA